MIRLNVNATSFAVRGSPSDHFTPSRMVRVQVRPSSEWDHFVASSGSGEMSFIE